MKNKREQLVSEDKKEQKESFSFHYVLKKGKRKQSLMRLITLISVMIGIIVLFCLLIAKIKRYYSIKQLNSELTISLNQLKTQENDLQSEYEQLNQEKEEITRRNEVLNKEIIEYKKKNEQLKKESDEIDVQIKQLEKELQSANDEGEKLDKKNEEAFKRIQNLQEESKKYDKDIEDLQKQIKELENQIDRKVSIPQIQSNIVNTSSDNNYIQSILPWSNVAFRCLYKKTDYGLDPDMFHKQCDGAEMTLILLYIKLDSGKYKIGGFTSRSWSLNKGNDYFKADRDAFLFSLTPQRKYNVRDVDRAIICDYNNLAAFNVDLSINDCGIRSNFPFAYALDTNNPKDTLISNEEFISANNVIEMEVFEVIR